MDIGRIISATDEVWIAYRDRINAAPMDDTIRAVVLAELHSAVREIQNVLNLMTELELQRQDDE